MEKICSKFTKPSIMPFSDREVVQEGMLDRYAEQRKIQDIMSRCRDDGRELLTPLAISTLFGISASAIRIARKKGMISAYVKLSVTGKTVELILLQAALQYWKKAPLDLKVKLTEYRNNGTTVAVDSEFFNILHSEKIAMRLV